MKGIILSLEDRMELIKQLQDDQTFHDLILIYHKLNNEMELINDNKKPSDSANLLNKSLWLLDEQLDFIKVLILRKAGIEIEIDSCISVNSNYAVINLIFTKSISITETQSNYIDPAYIKIFAYSLVFLDYFPK